VANHTGTTTETDFWTSTTIPEGVYGNAGHTHDVVVVGTCAATTAAITLKLKFTTARALQLWRRSPSDRDNLLLCDVYFILSLLNGLEDRAFPNVNGANVAAVYSLYCRHLLA
jgi:hypothetical protein